jgi:hypothetical protein
LTKAPLHRKELLWLWRDRGAIVQAVLIPHTLGAVQVFNWRYLVEQAGTAWHYLAGLAVICGTYFLIVLGPRSLISEGPALWITLTWPRGLESLLKAKAQLWWMLATIIVCSVFFSLCFSFLWMPGRGCAWVSAGGRSAAASRRRPSPSSLFPVPPASLRR